MKHCLVYDIISNNTSDNPLDLIDILKSFIILLEQKKTVTLHLKAPTKVLIYILK